MLLRGCCGLNFVSTLCAQLYHTRGRLEKKRTLDAFTARAVSAHAHSSRTCCVRMPCVLPACNARAPCVLGHISRYADKKRERGKSTNCYTSFEVQKVVRNGSKRDTSDVHTLCVVSTAIAQPPLRLFARARAAEIMCRTISTPRRLRWPYAHE